MVEMLGTLAIMGVLSVTGIWAYTKAIDSHKANRILNDLNARIHACSAQIVMMNKDECQLSSFPDKMDDAYATSVQKIDSDFFKVIISDIPQKICQQIINKGIPLASHINLTNCDETNQFELVFHKNLDSSIFRKKCTSDVDCDVCGSCDSDGYCLGECSLPSPDSEENCGENECIVYDEESKTCRDACERVEYLESTGSQYIDSGMISTSKSTVDVIFRLNDISQNGAIFGGRNTQLQKTFTLFYIGGSSKWFRFDYNAQRQIADASSITIDNNSKYKMSYNGVRAEITNMTTDETNGFPLSEGTTFTTTPIILFAVNTNSGGDPSNVIAGTYFKGKIYEYRYSDGANSIHFIPVISPDGEPCMFDKVSQKLFCNEGTGTFKTNKD